MKVLVIHNLQSGLRNGSIYDFIRTYVEDGDTITLRTFDGKTPFSELLKGAADYDFVVASGGDGTVATVCYELRNTGIPILPFPSGTANLMAMNLFSPNEPHALCKLVDAAQTLDFDLGEIEASNGEKRGFGIMAGCGYDEVIMRNASTRKEALGDVAYFEAAFTNTKPQVSEFIITVDGVPHREQGIGVVLANFSKIQFDMLVSNANLPRDGKLDAIVLKTKTAWELLPTFIAKALDSSGIGEKAMASMEVYRGKEIRIDAEPSMQIEYDGEPTKLTTPLVARCLPNACRLIISEEAYKHFSGEDE